VRPIALAVVGVDTSAESMAALDWALRLATGSGCRVVVVHAVGLLEEGGYRSRPDVGALVEDARRRTPEASDVAIEILAEDGPAADVIVRVAEREGADLIVVGSRGLGQAPRLLGSVSESILAHAHMPVLIVPGP
jgi:nucleotide-binding universal stress UspA family protein